MKVIEWSTCDECDHTVERVIVTRVYVGGEIAYQDVELCAECIRIAGIILARAEKDAAKDQVPSPEGERKA